MLNLPEFKAAMARNGMTQHDLAVIIGVSDRTFSERLKRRVFVSDEIEKLMEVLEIRDPMTVFFTSEVTCKVADKKISIGENDHAKT
ncbi:MAG: helix-turn-helix transcriptional regulator [Oscillospiraceae bacterium]|nr:helix-turn-helix transcriptional regulator [Oscillospiraceae bacterium]